MRIRNIDCPSLREDETCSIDSGSRCVCLDHGKFGCLCNFSHEHGDTQIGWILHCAVSDLNFKLAVPRLTDEELEYCLGKIKSKTGRLMLEREMKKRTKSL